MGSGISYAVREYLDDDDRVPFRKWLESLEPISQQRINARIFRIRLGNLGDYKSVGAGVLELILNFGSGVRVYFGFSGKDEVMLLHGGTKRTQKKDILISKKYWQQYLGIYAYDKKK